MVVASAVAGISQTDEFRNQDRKRERNIDDKKLHHTARNSGARIFSFLGYVEEVMQAIGVPIPCQ